MIHLKSLHQFNYSHMQHLKVAFEYAIGLPEKNSISSPAILTVLFILLIIYPLFSANVQVDLAAHGGARYAASKELRTHAHSQRGRRHQSHVARQRLQPLHRPLRHRNVRRW